MHPHEIQDIIKDHPDVNKLGKVLAYLATVNYNLGYRAAVKCQPIFKVSKDNS